jgi:quinol-cytochrome oxidoreductase complex cytochrome b subunit
MFAILVVTGMFLMIYYLPTPEASYRSMKDITFAVSFGGFMRNLHRWSAHGMVAIVFLHMCRVFFTGSYKRPRQFNWVVGALLFILTLGLSFTGYLLPWDQLAFWAITVGTSIATYAPVIGEKIKFLLLGGNVIGEAALLRFYILHCFVFPVAMTLLIGVHFWRVRKDGGLAALPVPVPEEIHAEDGLFPAGTRTYGLMALAKGDKRIDLQEPEDSVFAWPHLIYREFLWTLILLIALGLISVLWNAPLEEVADPTRTPNPAKAPWYFLGLQELVHYSALLGGVVAPGALVLLMMFVPYIDRSPHGSGIWFAPERKRANLLFAMVVGVTLILTAIGTFFRGPNWAWYWPW